MRVTSGMLSANLAAELQAAQAALGRQQNMIAGGKRVLVPSDDPGAATQAMAVRARAAANAQFQKNLAAARDALGSGESAVSSVIATLTRAKELGVQGSSDTNDALARESLGSEVDQLLENMVTLANGRNTSDGMLFGGQETTVAPYTVTRNVAGRITAVTPNARGIGGQTVAEVTEGVTVATAVSGTTVFGAPADPTYTFDVLIRLRDALNANLGVVVSGTLDDISSGIDRGTQAQTLIGSRLGWLDSLESRLKDDAVANSGSLSRLEDLDFAKAIEDLTQIQIAYQAAASAGARLMQHSLLDFLR